MHPVSTHGAAKITMNSQEAEYQQRLRQARAQADGNPHIVGAQAPHAQASSTGNMPAVEPLETTGNVELGTSATKTMQQNPEDFQTKALDDKISMYQAAAGNAYAGMAGENRKQMGNF